MAALQRLAVLAYCLCRRALPSTFFRPAWPGEPVRGTGVFNPFAGVLVDRTRPEIAFQGEARASFTACWCWRRFWHFDHPNFQTEFAAVQHKFHRVIS